MESMMVNLLVGVLSLLIWTCTAFIFGMKYGVAKYRETGK